MLLLDSITWHIPQYSRNFWCYFCIYNGRMVITLFLFMKIANIFIQKLHYHYDLIKGSIIIIVIIELKDFVNKHCYDCLRLRLSSAAMS